jgi:hypothetical protein
MRKVVLALSAAAAILFGLDKIGVTPIAPGHDVGFKWSTHSEQGNRELILTTDAGDLKCWLQLKVRTEVDNANVFHAKLSTSEHELAIAAEPIDQHAWRLRIFEPSKGGRKQVKFDWPSGVSLIVYASANPGSDLALEEWEVYLKDKESDSASKATWRRNWFWISLSLVFVSVVGAVYGALPERPALQPFTSQVCVGEIITRIEGASKLETRRIRSVLQKVVLEKASVAEALDATGLQGIESKKLWFTARHHFMTRLEELIRELVTYQQRLAS